MSIKKMSELTGISTSHLYSIFSGDAEPGKNAAKKIEKATGKNWWDVLTLNPEQLKKELEKAIS